MPLFYFDITDGECVRDPAGIMLADTEAARDQAIVFASERLKDHAARQWGGENWRIEVKDDLDLVLFTLTFSARPTEAARPRAAA